MIHYCKRNNTKQTCMHTKTTISNNTPHSDNEYGRFTRLKTILSAVLSMVFTAAAAQEALNPFGNALIPDMVADASITLIDGTYYCYATTDGYGRGLETSGPPVVWKSEDFVNWRFDGIYFPSAAEQKYWAPSKAVSANGKYYIYPTINGYMYPAVADSPDGPFKLARGKDEFHLPYTSSTLLQGDDRYGIDAEIFIDDNGQAYAIWGGRQIVKLKSDMITFDGDIHTIETRRGGYSEGPIFFKRNGIYYYLYTLGGDERYQYAYGMSRISPMGPYTFPEEDIITTTNYETGVFGPGHGCVFTDSKGNYYIAYLEFGRRSTNRQTYVNRLEFNDDGTIRPVKLDLNGVGALNRVKGPEPLHITRFKASSVKKPEYIVPMKDTLCNRTEFFIPEFTGDKSNGSRWMAEPEDTKAWIMADLGSIRRIRKSEIYFVQPTAGHSYRMEISLDGKTWTLCGGHNDIQRRSPHTDTLKGVKARYVRITITAGTCGVWEWKIY